MDMKRFYLWWVSVLFIGTGIFWAEYFGILNKIWVTDKTYLTSIIFFLFIIMNILIGYVTYHWDTYKRNNYHFRLSNVKTHSKNNLNQLIDSCWFMSEILMGLGMLGTVIGLIEMLSITSLGQDQDAVQILLTNMWSSLGLALYTNAVGLTTSIILKLQTYYIIEDANEK